MLVLCSGDHHFNDRSRFEECVRVHRWMVELARSEKPDVFLSGGDIYERGSTPIEREAVAEWLTTMAEVCSVVISKGNHDRARDVELMRRLRTRHPIVVEERAGIHRVAGAAIAAIAWPEPAFLMAQAESADQGSADLRAALANVLRGLGVQLAEHEGPRILIGHLMVDGSVTSAGQPLLGQPINVGLNELALARAQLGIIGHIHNAQVFDVSGAPHWYPGSPFRTSFGEMEKKLVLLAEFNGKVNDYSLDNVQQIETPATPMVHVEDEWGLVGAEMGWIVGDISEVPDACGAEIRLRYRVANEHREGAKAAAERWRDAWLAEGAASVKVEQEIVVETRARMPEVVAALSPSEKLKAYWVAKGFEPGERRDPLLAKFAQLESSCSAR
jgi:DNA repair exonuclease SbcCD nuclease subunit